MKIIHVFLVYLFSWLLLSVFAVENTPIVNEALSYNIRLWDIENGLPQNSIFSIENTPDGYLWLGTQSGLVRFNGVGFKVYNIHNTSALKNNDIQKLLCDSKSFLWIATVSGDLIRYKNDRFENFSDILNFSFSSISILKEDNIGRIWVGTDKNGLYYIKDSGVVKVLESSSRITGIEIDKNMNIIATDETHIYKISDNLSPIATPVKHRINCICRRGENGYWVGTREGLIFYDSEKGLMRSIDSVLQKDNIQSLFCDSDFTLWVGTKYNFSFVRNRTVYSIFKNMSSFHDKNILSIYESQYGNIWFGTSHGLYRLTQDRFTALDKNKGLKDDIATTCLEDEEGNIWIGTLSGLNYYSVKDKAIKYIKHSILENSQILSLYEADGYIYAGTNKGVFILKDKILVKHINESNGLKAIYPRTILKDNEGSILIGTELGVYTLTNNHVDVLKNGKTEFTDYVFYMSNATDGSVWVGCNEQLYRFKEDIFMPIDLSPDQTHERILCSYEDKEGYTWFGTYGLGLFRYKDGESYNITMKEGLVGNDVFTISCDSNGFFWMSHNEGISQVNIAELNSLIDGDIKKLDVKNYTEDDGMKSRECVGGRTPAANFTKDGVLMVCTAKGVVFTDPLFNYEKKTIIPKVNIERVVADNTEYSPLETAVFPAGTKMIGFDFVGINLMAPGKVNYRYRIKGENEKWIYNGKDRTLKISNLSPGDHVFQVTARTGDEDWNNVYAEYRFSIRPFFYETVAFFVLIFVCVCLIVLFAHFNRVRKLAERKKELEDQVQERTEELKLEKMKTEKALTVAEKANQMKTELLGIVAHDLKNPLQYIMSSSFLIEHSLKNPEKVLSITGKLKKVADDMVLKINKLLSLTALDSGEIALSIQLCSLEEIMTNVIDKYKHQLDKKNQKLEFSFSGNTQIDGDKEKLSELIENLFSNAIKYSYPSGQIDVELSENGNTVKMIVQDYGQGFSNEDRKDLYKKFKKLSSRPTGDESSSGYGLFIVKRIVELHNGAIELASEKGNGSKFIVNLPKNRN